MYNTMLAAKTYPKKEMVSVHLSSYIMSLDYFIFTCKNAYKSRHHNPQNYTQYLLISKLNGYYHYQHDSRFM